MAIADDKPSNYLKGLLGQKDNVATNSKLSTNMASSHALPYANSTLGQPAPDGTSPHEFSAEALNIDEANLMNVQPKSGKLDRVLHRPYTQADTNRQRR